MREAAAKMPVRTALLTIARLYLAPVANARHDNRDASDKGDRSRSETVITSSSPCLADSATHNCGGRAAPVPDLAGAATI